MVTSLYCAAWIFVIYAFLGWCTEVVFAACKSGKFVNRGFLNGPVCPIYGFGILAVLLCLSPLADNLPLLFLGSLVLTTAIEFFTGFLLEKLFHQKWWDYSKRWLNVRGYVCPLFSLIWALACVAVVKLVHPPIGRLIERFPKVLGTVLLCVFIAGFVADAIVTFIGVSKLPARFAAMAELAERLHKLSDGLGEGLYGGTEKLLKTGEKLKSDLDARPEAERLKARLDELARQRGYIHRRLVNAFPNLTAGKFGSVAEYLKNAEAELKNKRNK